MYVDESAKISPRTGTVTVGELPHFSTPSALIVGVMRHFHTPNGAPRIAKQRFVLMGNGVHSHLTGGFWHVPVAVHVVCLLVLVVVVILVSQTSSSLSTLATRPSAFLPSMKLNFLAITFKSSLVTPSFQTFCHRSTDGIR